jgi:hypothetical protein
MTESSIQIVYVGAGTLRQRFNALDYYGQVQRGELVPVIIADHPAREDLGFPSGTRTQRVIYMRGQAQIALVHQYLLPDGKVGASGLPDPKWVRDGTRILKLARPESL